MTDAILAITVLYVFVLGYFLMKQLDKTIAENRDFIKKENESTEPSCIILTEEFSDEEIMQEINRFRKTHNEMNIILSDAHKKNDTTTGGELPKG